MNSDRIYDAAYAAMLFNGGYEEISVYDRAEAKAVLEAAGVPELVEALEKALNYTKLISELNSNEAEELREAELVLDKWV